MIRLGPNGPLLLLRADADRAIGYGHIFRSLALAQGWQHVGGTAVMLADCEGSLPRELTAGDVRLVRMSHRFPDPQDLVSMYALLQNHHDAWVSCDGYHLDRSYTRALHMSGAHVLVVDDIAQAGEYEADIILNPNIYADELRYVCAQGTQMLLGPRYALLRSQFGAWCGWQRQISDDPRRVLIMMGGSDVDQQTSRVMRAIASVLHARQLTATVVAGPGDRHADDLHTLAQRTSASFEVVQDPADVPGLMAQADVAISGGGSTSWELCFMGVPSILLTLAVNQAGIAAGLSRAGAALSVGWSHEVSDAGLASMLGDLLDDVSLRRQLSERARTLVDGHGVSRVTRAMRGEAVT